MKLAKKLIFAAVLIALVLCAVSCDVHVGSEHYDVAWYWIAVPVVIFVAVSLIIAGKVLTKFTYVCPHCGEKFSPKFSQTLFSVHMGSDRYFKCPHCGKRGFCSVYRGGYR
ncbi:MAG: hypothetical protein IJV00_02095 [Clostridia bacterium]|nr:hypothetical protein [Clostridia bacterium]